MKTFEIIIEGKKYNVPTDPPADIGFPIIYAFTQFSKDALDYLKNPDKVIKVALMVVKIVDPTVKEIKPTTSELMDLINKVGLHFTFGAKQKK